MENSILCKWNKEKARGAILRSDKIDFKNKDCYKRQERSLHKEQGANSRRIYNSCKYTCTHHRSTQYIRQTLTAIKGEIHSNTIKVRNFNTPMGKPMGRLSKQKINFKKHSP